MKCPACHAELDVRLIKAPPQQADQVKRVTNGGANVSDVGALMESAHAQQLNEWEAGFIDDVQERFDKYGDRIKMTEKQMAILRKISIGETEDF